MDVDDPLALLHVKEGDVPLDTFEWILQWLERRAFKASANAELYSDRHAAQFDDTPCNICRMRESDDLNQILICDGCEVAVHQTCYGIRSIPEGAWKCEACAQQLNPANLICELCMQVGGGVFKPITNFHPVFSDADLPEQESWRIKRLRKQSTFSWGHVQCAMWLAIAGIEKEDGEGPIVQRPTKRIDLESRCNLCNREKGATTKCAEFGCNTRFHILCAQKKAFALFTSRSRYVAYCDQHTPSKFSAWRKEQLKHRDIEKLARRKVKRRRESLALTGGRRGDNVTAQAMRYWSGLAEETTIPQLHHALAQEGRSTGLSVDSLKAVFRHWIAKRTKTAGIPLLKSFHPSFATNSSTVLLNAMRGNEVEKVYRKLRLIRERLEQLKEIAARCVDREHFKQRQMIARRRVYENVLLPTLGAQTHLLSIISTDLDVNRTFLACATVEHPFDWLTVLERARAGQYRHDENVEGGGSFFADLLSVVDPSKVPSHLLDEAEIIRDKLIKIRDGNVAEVPLIKTKAPLSIVLPRATIDVWRSAYAKMKSNPDYAKFM